MCVCVCICESCDSKCVCCESCVCVYVCERVVREVL